MYRKNNIYKCAITAGTLKPSTDFL